VPSPASAHPDVQASALGSAEHAAGSAPDVQVARTKQLIWALVVGVFLSVMLLWRISAFGIWDPWELSTADAARRLAAGESAAPGSLSFTTWLVSLGFRAFDVHEWAGRLPIVLAGLTAVMSAYLAGARFADARTGLYAALITGTSPLFVFNARTMLGAAPDFAVQSALAFAAFSTLLPARTSVAGRTPRLALWLSFTLLATILAVTTRGALLSALPPLAAAVAVALLAPAAPSTGLRRLALGILTLVTLGLVAMILRDGILDAAEYSPWLGGRAGSSATLTFDSVIEQVFHAFAPWSALLPVAMGRLWIAGTPLDVDNSPATRASERALSHACIIWAALGYAAQTLFVSRYGREVTFLPLVAIALLVAMFLRDVERRGDSQWSAGVAVAFLAGLVLRDYALYPNGPVQGMPISSFEVPKIWNPVAVWSGLLTPFIACALLGLCADASQRGRVDLWAPYRVLKQQWQRGLGFKLWLIVGAMVLLGLCVLGALGYAIPARLHMPTLALKWVRRLVYAPAALALLLAVGQVLLFVFARLASFRFVPMLVVGAAIGSYASQGFLPGLSEHFSPREVYTSYNALAHAGEALGEYHVGGRAAAYYAKGQILELKSVQQLIDHLTGPGQRWAAFPSEELAEIDKAYRQRTHRHLILADARSARVVLAASQALANKHDENYLRDAVRSAAPAKIQHAVSVNFDDRIELLGYDLALPHDNYVGAGETFTISWYLRVQRRIPSGYRMFVHIDGQGQRIHGDHDPIEGKYPVQLWEEGDVIVDVQKIDVPASYRSGDYAILMGFYSGDTRLPIKQGPTDGDDNRARVGVLRIQ
jgi:hypothetical protein